MSDTIQANQIKGSIGVDTVGIQKWMHNATISEKEKMKECSRQFESIMISNMIKDGLKPHMKGVLNEENASHDMYRSWLCMALGDAMSHTGALKISDILYKQVSQGGEQ